MCIFHALVVHWSIPCFFILACLVYLILCSTLFCLRIELHFLIHLAPLMHHIIIVRSFISYLHFSLTLCLFLTKRGRVYYRKYTRVFCHFYMTLVHILRGRNSISHAHLQGERYSIGEMHIPRGRRHWVNNKTLFCLFLFMFVFLFCIVFVFWTCIYPYAIVLHWIHVWMIICFAMWSL